MRTAPDPGLRAVARVRSVRERDSRLGLQQALAEERAHAEQLGGLRDRLASAVPPAAAGTRDFLRSAADRSARAAAVSAAEADLETARVVALTARDRWLADQQQLAAVETLLERRAAERREERRRAEDKAQDETATNVWRRAAQARGGAR